jgi:hypothetical protein
MGSHQKASPLCFWPFILVDKKQAPLLIAWLLPELKQGFAG